MSAHQTGVSTRSPRRSERAILAPPHAFLRFVVWFGLVTAVVVGIAVGAIGLLVDDRRATLEAAAAARIEAVAQGRVAILNTWLDGAARIGKRLTGSELVRLFAAEMALTEPGTSPPGWLANQRRYIANQIADFVHQHDLLGVALYGLDGRTLLASPDAPLVDIRGLDAPVADIRGLDALIDELRRSGHAFSPIRQVAGAGLGLDILLPIPGPQPATSGRKAQLVAALAMTLTADQPLARVLAGPPPEGAGAVRLVQAGPTGRATIVTAGDHGPRLTPAATPVADRSGDFTLEVPVPGPSWRLELDSDDRELAHALQRYRRDLARGAGAAGGGLLLVLAALWGLHNRLHRRDLRRQATALQAPEPIGAGAFDALAQLTPGPVAIKTREGRYRYVNPALARVFGLPAEAIVGRTDAELLGETAAAALAAGDGQALDGRAVLDDAVELEIAGRRRALRVFKLPLKNHAEEVRGVLLAARDASADADREGERAALVAQVTRLSCALAAPEAAGWLARVQRLRRYACAVACRLDLPADQRTALDRAAFWSQIGRLPALAAEDALPLPNDPLVAAILDRLHGAPDDGHAAAEAQDRWIGPSARILEVVDAFVTLVDDASGTAISPGQALYRLAEPPGRFDMRAIAGLTAVIEDEIKGRAAPADARAAPAIEAEARPRRRGRAA